MAIVKSRALKDILMKGPKGCGGTDAKRKKKPMTAKMSSVKKSSVKKVVVKNKY